MDGVELFRLGRALARLGERAIPPSGFHDLPVRVRSVLVDVFEHPDSSIQDITARTGLPQSHVSASVARLREVGVLTTSQDPTDRRRTLVRRARGVPTRVHAPVDAVITERVGPERAQEAMAALETLARLFT
ncbi:DNA-binding transcriptional ArsR family regulator [Actinokineospora baliensis]|uniref:MarR family transcriptional regulator n=1 Tax=Actinokineospora baliensis TaxID=547056 RepID=UPI0019564645|nr:helix-turn-helix domain-containing protein [Actinokineospora baliensis]MBM7775373.1 DNA-binding transcriptional ArsR family regulator [Actinokineospora baliensis]